MNISTDATVIDYSGHPNYRTARKYELVKVNLKAALVNRTGFCGGTNIGEKGAMNKKPS